MTRPIFLNMVIYQIILTCYKNYYLLFQLFLLKDFITKPLSNFLSILITGIIDIIFFLILLFAIRLIIIFDIFAPTIFSFL